jgi:hypothetical protein
MVQKPVNTAMPDMCHISVRLLIMLLPLANTSVKKCNKRWVEGQEREALHCKLLSKDNECSNSKWFLYRYQEDPRVE